MRNASVGPNAFAAFESAFKTLNVRAGKIRGANSIAVADVDLVGIDALWSLSVEVCSSGKLFKAVFSHLSFVMCRRRMRMSSSPLQNC